MDRLEHFFRHFAVTADYDVVDSPGRLTRISDLVKKANYHIDQFCLSEDYHRRPKKITNVDRAIRKVGYNRDYIMAVACFKVIRALQRAKIEFEYVEAF